MVWQINSTTTNGLAWKWQMKCWHISIKGIYSTCINQRDILDIYQSKGYIWHVSIKGIYLTCINQRDILDMYQSKGYTRKLGLKSSLLTEKLKAFNYLKAHCKVWDNFWHLKKMKNALYFTSKALFIIKIFKFLSWLFGHVGKRLD